MTKSALVGRLLPLAIKEDLNISWDLFDPLRNVEFLFDLQLRTGTISFRRLDFISEVEIRQEVRSQNSRA